VTLVTVQLALFNNP